MGSLKHLKNLLYSISDLAWSRIGVEPAELSEIAVNREVFQVFLRL